ncbi:MAG TPA: Na+/H+ antiporter NhaA [Nocardioidaceae bacterium]|nr:Na+/H+ antiporter NhaA [Nocardioidaceae bacterium]
MIEGDERPAASGWRESTLWTARGAGSLQHFLRTETGSAAVLVAAIVAALVWANIDIGSYDDVWTTTVSVRLGDSQASHDLRTWINDGLMTFFFLVVGLEARREIDLGDLRERRRFLLPLVAGLLAMIVPIGLYLAVNHGGSGAQGWGVAMSTDTALALGVLAISGQYVPSRVRIFLVTVFVVDDLAALLVIALFYSNDISMTPLLIAVGLMALLVVAQVAHFRQRTVYLVLGVLIWVALTDSGVDPVVAGLAIGLSASAFTPSRDALDRATGLFREFREQPTAELARTAAVGVSAALSPNERLQLLYHPWTSYVVVPLFALANIGIVLDGDFLRTAFTAPITLGMLAGYLIGKPIGVVVGTALVSRMTRGGVRSPVCPVALLGSGLIAGVGFTVPLLIADRAFEGEQLAEAKFGALTATAVAAVLTWAVFRATSRLPGKRRARALVGDAETIVDLVPDVVPKHDRIRGPLEASVTVVEYGDFECPYCGRAEESVRELLADTDLRYVWRHLPLTEVHPYAQLAAEASEAAAAQGAFWEMHDLLLTRQDRLRPMDLVAYAGELGLDQDRFHDDLKRHVYAAKIAKHVHSADLSGVSGTPTFFINGQRHYGTYDIATLKAAVKAARARAVVDATSRAGGRLSR